MLTSPFLSATVLIALLTPPASGAGATVADLESGVRVTALASGDFDGDGVRDLLSAHESPDGGILLLHRGNVESLFPHSVGARVRGSDDGGAAPPLLPPAEVHRIPVPPDLLGIGDFDNDGDLEVVAAAVGGNRLELMTGDGRGRLRASTGVTLPGQLTALATGEINRPDGLVDLVVGTDGPDGPVLLVFQDSRGALRATPVRVPLSAPAVGLSMARLTACKFGDLVVGAGNEVLIVSGPIEAGSEPIVSARLKLASEVASVVAGDFARDADRQNELAVLTADGVLHVLGADLPRQREAARGRPGFFPEVAMVARPTPQTGTWSVLGSRALASPDGTGAELLRARVSGRQTEDLIVVDGAAGSVRVLSGMVRQTDSQAIADWGATLERESAGGPLVAHPMRLAPRALSDLVVLRDGDTSPTVSSGAPRAVITVNSDLDTAVAADGNCTLREAIENANTDSDTTAGDCAPGSGTDDIGFAIGGGGVFATITPGSALPPITAPVTINGDTQGCASLPCIELDGGSAGAGVNGFAITGGNTTIRGFVINRFSADGIRIESAGNVIEGNYIGTDASGTVALANGGGIIIVGVADNIVGGTAPGARNIISGNASDGVFLTGATNNNVVLGNYIGTDVTGFVDLGNLLAGFEIQGGSFNTLGGTAPGARNVISGNDDRGILLDINSSNNEILGNYIGTDAGGTIDLGNLLDGIQVAGPLGDNLIGGTAVGARNLISGNEGDGIFLFPATVGNDILGNYVGTDVTGTVALGNTLAGIEIQGTNSNNNNIGDAIPGARNLISANGDRGVLLDSTGLNEVLGNYIGTDVTGSVDLGNALIGVHIFDSVDNTVGGPSPEATNLISGNDREGVLINGGSTGNEVLGNMIGTDGSGTADLGNALAGVSIVDAPGNRVGGPVPGEGNVISGNGGNGVAIIGSPSSGNVVQANAIGSGPGLGNDLTGVLIDGASSNVIGGAGNGEGNLIANNLEEGIVVLAPGVGNSILRNAIVSNARLGIDLERDGVTPNDPGDPDPGANALQNYPALTAAAATPAPDVTIDGSLNSTSTTTFRIEFFASQSCDGSGHGEGERFLGFTTQTTDAAGNVSFSTLLPAPVSDGEQITATATGELDDTSEFAQCFTASCSNLVVFPHTILALDKNTLEWPLPEDVRFAKGRLADVRTYTTIDDGFMMGATVLDISRDMPAPGDGLYYVVKPLGCGSWQSSPGVEPGRDGGLP